MEVEFINPPDVYAPTWKFTQAVKVSNVGSLVFLSGIIGIDTDGNLPDDITEQARLIYESMRKTLEAAGGSMDDIVKMNTYVGPDYQDVKEGLRDARSAAFSSKEPAASTLLQVAGFANPDYLIEVDAIAVLGEPSGSVD